MLRNDPRYKDNLTDFQRRYEPNFAWGNAVAGMMLLQGLRGLWPMSVHASGGNAIDHSGLGKTMSYNGNPVYRRYGLVPYIDLDGTGDFLSRADEADLDIIGNEAYIGNPGLTLGGWWWFDVVNTDGTNAYTMMSKTGVPGDRGFGLSQYGAGGIAAVHAQVSSDGTALTTVASTNAVAISTWYFSAMRYVPSTSVDLYVDLNKYTEAVAVPATIVNNTLDLRIGVRSDASYPLNGRATLCFLCAAALSDTMIWTIYHQTRALFGK